ncbi:MAG: hypothetical protein WBM39_02335 [Parasphingorhabdus sp.]
MRYLFFAVLIILVIMSLAAGGAKVSHMPQEIQFFRDAGINSSWLLPLGGLQIIGGLLAVYHRTRQLGLAVVALGFLVSTIVIFMTGNVTFGVFSSLPVMLCVFIIWRSSGSSQPY